MKIPENYKFTEDHEWIKIDGDVAYIGVTEYAAQELGDVVFIDIDTVGETLEKREVFANIEAVKTVSDIFLPVAAEILAFNEQLEENPQLVNKDPYGEGWIVKVKVSNAAELEELLSSEAYAKIVE